MSPRHELYKLGLAAGLVLALSSCSQPSSLTPTATSSEQQATDPTPTFEIVIETLEPSDTNGDEAALPTSTISAAAGTYTNIIDIDAVIEAVLSGDKEEVRPLIGFLTTPCTLAEGLGGPPKCAAGESEGDPVTVFPYLGSEGGFARENEIDGVLDSLNATGLFGVYIVPQDAADESYWPRGDYGLVFTGEGPTSAYTVLMKEGRIVRIVYHMGTTAAEAFDNGRGEIILAPVE